MAKKTGLTSTVSLKKKKVLPKKTMKMDILEVEQAAKDIKRKEKNQKSTRVTIDIPNDRYLEMKIKVVTEGKTIRSYFLELLEKDLG